MSKLISLPSAHDVARLAGVSQSAVSRSFTPGASVSKATREKVMRAAASVGYRPNIHARILKSGSSGIVGTVIGSPRNPMFMAALDELSQGLSAAGKHLLVSTAEGHPTADVHIKALLNCRVDALLLMATNMSPQLARQCQQEGIPVISFNRERREGNGVLAITSDDKEGAKHIAAHLLQQGYRRFGFIAGHPDSSVSRERESAFTAYLTSRGVPRPERAVGYFQRDTALQAARDLLARKPKLDAIFCANDAIAFSAIEVARYECGLEIGRQIGIAGFDDLRESSWHSFNLTTYSLPIKEMVNEALKILLANSGAKKPLLTVVKGEFKQRGSTQRTAT